MVDVIVLRRIGLSLMLLLAAAMVGCAGPGAQPPPDVSEGPASTGLRFDDQIVLSNGVVSLTVAPDVGRVVGFAPAGGPELIWLNDAQVIDQARADGQWVHIGGDKVWPALQAMWGRYLPHGNDWPPDPAYDGSAWDVLGRTDRRVVIVSPVGEALNIRITRIIELDPALPRVTIDNRIERIGPSVFPVHIWSVSQVEQPRYTLLDVRRRWPQGPMGHEHHAVWGNWNEDTVSRHVTPLADGQALRWDLRHAGGGKIGTLGTWCAAVYDDWVLVQQSTLDEHGSYPDASNLQAYTHGEYLELETLSPQSHPRPGESIENTVVWTLVPTDGRDDAALVRAIEALAAVPGEQGP